MRYQKGKAPSRRLQDALLQPTAYVAFTCSAPFERR